MGAVAPRTIFANDTGPLTGTGLDTLAKNQGAILELEGAQAPQSKTIASGSISPTAAYVIVDTEGSAAADDLDVISPVLSASENLHDGMIVYLKAADSGRVVTVKNSGSANGINTYDGNDYVLSAKHWLKLQLRSGKWYEVEGRAMETALAAADHAKTKSGTSSTASGTAAKVVTCAGFELSDQARIFVTFSNANTVADAITLNVNGTGAKAVYNQTGIISTTNTALFAANQPIEFRYDGTGWVFYDVAKASSVITALAEKANLDLDNLTQTGTTAIAHAVKPSERRISYTLTWGQTYSAPADGVFNIFGTATALTQARLEIFPSTGSLIYRIGGTVQNGTIWGLRAPLRKGDRCIPYGDAAVTGFFFIYDEGAY